MTSWTYTPVAYVAYSLLRNCRNKLSAKRYICRDLSRKRAAVVLVVTYRLFDCILSVGGRYNTRRIIAVMDRHKLSSCKKKRKTPAKQNSQLLRVAASWLPESSVIKLLHLYRRGLWLESRSKVIFSRFFFLATA